MFIHKYLVPFHDTDAMGVVHHSNYIRIMEAGRVAWMKSMGFMKEHIPYGPMVLALTKIEIDYLRPSRFDDEIKVVVEGRLVGAVLDIRYALWVDRVGEWIATGRTELAPLNAATLVPTRFAMADREKLRNQPMGSTWPPEPLS